jgi:hypothetical protein
MKGPEKKAGREKHVMFSSFPKAYPAPPDHIRLRPPTMSLPRNSSQLDFFRFSLRMIQVAWHLNGTPEKKAAPRGLEMSRYGSTTLTTPCPLYPAGMLYHLSYIGFMTLIGHHSPLELSSLLHTGQGQHPTTGLAMRRWVALPDGRLCVKNKRPFCCFGWIGGSSVGLAVLLQAPPALKAPAWIVRTGMVHTERRGGGEVWIQIRRTGRRGYGFEDGAAISKRQRGTWTLKMDENRMKKFNHFTLYK